MEKLRSLPNISRLSDAVVRILGQNPGKLALQGTNTYILGKQRPFILVDTGDGQESYLPLLESALKDASASTVPKVNANSRSSLSTPPEVFIDEPMVGDIILTHRHHDHCNGLPSVLKLLRRLWDENQSLEITRDLVQRSSQYRPPRIHKYPLDPNEPDRALEAVLDTVSVNLFSSPSSQSTSTISSHTHYTGQGIFHDLRDGQIISAPGISLTVVHTPGHTSDSICLLSQPINEENTECALFTGDTVLGQGTTVFEDLKAYIDSLQRLLHLPGNYAQGHETVSYSRLYPGHGPVVDDGPSLIKTYIQHRLDRENEILHVLRSSPQGETNNETFESPWTLWDITQTIYKTYPEKLLQPASRSVLLHLKKLEQEGRVKRTGYNDDRDYNRQCWKIVQSKM